MILLRALHLLEGKLACKFYMSHLPRRFTALARLADYWSRISSIKEADRRAVSGIRIRKLEGELTEWVKAPRADWDLPNCLAA